jgi:hypothetical protein
MDGCDVYFNLTRHVWSVRDRQTGLVARHARVVVFPHGASLVVNKGGRARVLREGVKNVHAFVRGTRAVYSADVKDWADWLANVAKLGGVRITYNPYKADHFTRKDNGERIDSASVLVMIAEEGAPPQVWAVPHAA